MDFKTMEIRELTKEIRDNAIERTKPKDLEYLATSWYQEDLLYSGKGKSIFLILPTPGCSWEPTGETGYRSGWPQVRSRKRRRSTNVSCTTE